MAAILPRAEGLAVADVAIVSAQAGRGGGVCGAIFCYIAPILAQECFAMLRPDKTKENLP